MKALNYCHRFEFGTLVFIAYLHGRQIATMTENLSASGGYYVQIHGNNRAWYATLAAAKNAIETSLIISGSLRYEIV